MLTQAGAMPFVAYGPLQRYPGRIHLFRALEQPFGCVEERSLGWSHLAAGGLEIIDTPGYHMEILEEPNVAPLAAALAKVLREFKDLGEPV